MLLCLCDDVQNHMKMEPHCCLVLVKVHTVHYNNVHGQTEGVVEIFKGSPAETLMAVLLLILSIFTFQIII